MAEIPAQDWSLFQLTDAPVVPEAPFPNFVWRFEDKSGIPGATARVYLAKGRDRLEKPVILSDGFNSGPSNFDEFWYGLNTKDYPFADKLLELGHDVILLGYDERSASILHNAERARQCIMKVIAERHGNAGLVVGGFSMGGIITRYALAKLEAQQIQHETNLYISFDSPHRGAWVPIGLQNFAHMGGKDSPLSEQINSPASQELLFLHVAEAGGEPQQSPLRANLLDQFERVGEWPQRPRLIAVANGNGTGAGNGNPEGTAPALELTSVPLAGTTMYTQASGAQALVLEAKLNGNPAGDIRTDDLQEYDRAPGGKLASFAIAADNINEQLGEGSAVAHLDDTCFVPTVSALSIQDPFKQDVMVNISKLPSEDSDFHDFRYSAGDTMHSQMTDELARWLIEEIHRAS